MLIENLTVTQKMPVSGRCLYGVGVTPFLPLVTPRRTSTSVDQMTLY